MRPNRFACATWLTRVCDIPYHHAWRDSFLCENLTHAHPEGRHIMFTCVTCLICICDVTHSYLRHYSFIHVALLIHMCDATLSHVRHDSCTPWGSTPLDSAMCFPHVMNAAMSAKRTCRTCINVYKNTNICMYIHSAFHTLWMQLCPLSAPVVRV